MIPYNEWLALARRYDAVVDFASPMTAWTPQMLVSYRPLRQSERTHENLFPVCYQANHQVLRA